MAAPDLSDDGLRHSPYPFTVVSEESAMSDPLLVFDGLPDSVKRRLGLILENDPIADTLTLEVMTITIVENGDFWTDFKYRFPNSDIIKMGASPNSWMYFSFADLRVGNTYTLMGFCQKKGRNKTVKPFMVIEDALSSMRSAANQSKFWNSKINKEPIQTQRLYLGLEAAAKL